ncbi:hypothetical protein ACSBR1_034004 [Camellia fascicularis]
MAATLSLSALLPPSSNTHHFPHISNPISNSYISTSLSLLYPNSFRSPKSIPPSNSLKSLPSTSTPYTIQSPNPDYLLSAEPILRSDAVIKMPTAPWMKGPLLLHPNQVLDLSKPRKKKNNLTNDEEENPDPSLTDRVSGGRRKKAMKKIFEGVGKLQETLGSEETQKNPEEIGFDFSLGELGEDGNPKFGEKMPWESNERVVFRRTKKEKVVTAAEVSLDGELLGRLRGEAARMRKWVKVMKAGVTHTVIDQIHQIWKDNELAMVKFDLPLCRNMDRAREIVEIKTGGLVVWCKKDALVVYRGCNYQFRLRSFSKMHSGFAGGQTTSSLNIRNHQIKLNMTLSQVESDESTGEEMKSRNDGEMANIPINGSLYEREADRLLDGLGPRFIDWWRPKPLPVDADLLPEVVPGFKPPFRLCPPHARAKLTDDELTYLRKLARPLPFHFVLGRNRKLQGLAAAILKLWEKCHTVKIAVKFGIPNTNNAQMAYELKCLTGGVLLLRNKFIIILYRGKDFLTDGVANQVAEREMELSKCQIQEEVARLKAIETFHMTDESHVNTSTSGSLSEFKNIQSECANLKNRYGEVDVQLQAEKEILKKQLRNQERKLFILKVKIRKSTMELSKLNSAWRPSEQDADQEMLTQEERECFRKMGLKMDSNLVLGRRGVFDGVIEGLHQHWKHREIAKVITMQRLYSQVLYTAKHLEVESGGILVSVDKLIEGHAIIIYRGKNYKRPLNLVPPNLLSKREALHRSLEMQRIGSLKFFAYKRQQEISDLKCKLADLEKRWEIDKRESDKVTWNGLKEPTCHGIS